MQKISGSKRTRKYRRRHNKRRKRKNKSLNKKRNGKNKRLNRKRKIKKKIKQSIVFQGDNCDFIDFALVGTPGSGCVDGTKMVLKNKYDIFCISLIVLWQKRIFNKIVGYFSIKSMHHN